MAVYLCTICHLYVYDEKNGDAKLGIKPRTSFSDIPNSFHCPICKAKKELFKKLSKNEGQKAIDKYYSYIKKNTSNEKQYNLVQVRNKARELLKGICAVNISCDGEPDRLCIGQKYGQPIGFGGVGKGLSFNANVQALDKIKLKTRLITDHAEPDMSTIFLERKIDIPVMTSSLSGVNASMGGVISEFEFATSVLQGAKDSGTIGWIGNTCDEGQELTGLKAVVKVGVGIPIFKPQNNKRLLELIEMAEHAKAIAVGVDLDGVGSTNWERKNKPVYRKSAENLKELVDSTDLPFIAKGIMSVDDALLALDSGVSSIDVSNHGGRSLDSTRGVADVLPKIVKAIDGKITITASGGIRTGFDVLKILALGADGALIGRDIIKSVIGGGSQGVKLYFEYLKSDLRRGMILTSCNSVDQIGENILDKQ